MFTLNCNGRLLVFDSPVVMGIINLTNDSFYQHSRIAHERDLIETAEKMLDAGATFLDIGAQSTRPGFMPADEAEERQKLSSAIALIAKRFPEAVISADTYQSSVARAAVEAGALIINDISGGNADGDMLQTVAALRVPYICMHIKGLPATMHDKTNYNDITREVIDYFIAKLEQCRLAGIRDVIVDPGFGFSKNISQNLLLLQGLPAFRLLEKPLLAGVSRKSTIYKTLGITADEALNGTTVLNTICLLNGADILRVHDVREAIETVKLVKVYKEAANAPVHSR